MYPHCGSSPVEADIHRPRAGCFPLRTVGIVTRQNRDDGCDILGPGEPMRGEPFVEFAVSLPPSIISFVVIVYARRMERASQGLCSKFAIWPASCFHAFAYDFLPSHFRDHTGQCVIIPRTMAAISRPSRSSISHRYDRAVPPLPTEASNRELA